MIEGNPISVGKDLITDNQSNIYVAGCFYESATFGSTTLFNDGHSDPFVAKLNSSGEWQWATKANGNQGGSSRSLSIDDEGNFYIAGNFHGTVYFGDTALISEGWSDIFVAKINSEGEWLWAKRAGGANTDLGLCISVNQNGDSYVTGNFEGFANFGNISLNSYGGQDVFIAKLNSSGDWQWVNKAGGYTQDVGHGLCIDSSENIYIIGNFNNSATFGNMTLTSFAYNDVFVAKLNNEGDWLWVQQAGGNYFDNGYAISIYNNENCYVTGLSRSDSINFGDITLENNNEYNIFIAKLDSLGEWQWAKISNSTGQNHCKDLSIDINGNIYITGDFTDTITLGNINLTSYDYMDIFVSKLNSLGEWQWAKKGWGDCNDEGLGIYCDGNECFFTGVYQNSVTFGNYNLTNYLTQELFVTKIHSSGLWLGAVDGDEGEFNFSGVNADMIHNPQLNQITNFPNPFNPSTTIDFSIQNDSKVELSIYNSKGQKIKTLAKNEFSKGFHSIDWNGDDDSGKSVSSGIYYYKFNVNGKTEALKKCLLLK